MAASLLWQTGVPDGLILPEIDAERVVGGEVVDEAEDFERFLLWTFAGSQLALLAVLAIYARRGTRFIRESAAGRIGTGMLLGMLGLALVWLSQLPFQLVELWWLRRHELWNAGYVDWFVERWVVLGAEFLFICLWLLITMALAAVFRRSWWLPAVPVFVGLALLLAFVYPYLVADQRPVPPELARDAVRFAERQDTEPVKVVVEDWSEFTSMPNAYAAGLGPSRRIVLWDTLLDGRFEDDEVRVVLAHELAHHSREHIWKSGAWYALLLLPLLGGVAWLTNRRGGLYQPRAVPLALLALVGGSLLLAPLDNAASREMEAEADWIALETTRDPAAARDLFRGFAREALQDPTPPGWAYHAMATHPSIAERIAMATAWERRNAR
ncbi:MAG TPA: M48 family metalloprotease [Gaiellaceae bacterium]|nr:M48 family metalloprotease [Gaiellaceae bacterium]